MNWEKPFSLPDLQALLDHETDTLEANPLKAPWGYYLETQNGWGYFCWFRSPEARLAYLIQVEMLHAPTEMVDGETYRAAVDSLIPMGQAVAEGRLAGEAACEAFNGHFREFQLRWFGHFEELCQGAEPFAQALRTAFRQQATPEQAVENLKPEERSDFIAFLEHYGL